MLYDSCNCDFPVFQYRPNDDCQNDQQSAGDPDQSLDLQHISTSCPYFHRHMMPEQQSQLANIHSTVTNNPHDTLQGQEGEPESPPPTYEVAILEFAASRLDLQAPAPTHEPEKLPPYPHRSRARRLASYLKRKIQKLRPSLSPYFLVSGHFDPYLVAVPGAPENVTGDGGHGYERVERWQQFNWSNPRPFELPREDRRGHGDQNGHRYGLRDYNEDTTDVYQLVLRERAAFQDALPLGLEISEEDAQGPALSSGYGTCPGRFPTDH